jgi:tRNA pseudouridine38-40 synthase
MTDPDQGPQRGGLVRVRLDLGYDGTDFAGWAEQPNLRTVAGTLRAAVATVVRTAPDVLALVVAGRTDAGVHATGQVCHLDLPAEAFARVPGRSLLSPSDALLRRLAGVLPGDLRVHRVTPAPAGFDARFSALRRRYAYLICDDASGAPPLRRRDVLAHRRPLDVEAMDDAAGRLVGLRDFAAFCKRREGATTVRTLEAYGWSRSPDGFVVARVVADAFCHSMVRALVGAVVPVGEGRRPPDWPVRVLLKAVRDPGVVVVPAHGLRLEEVVYPPDAQLASRALEARARRDEPTPRVAERQSAE